MDIETMYNLQGQTAVIIGGARDLGYDMAEILAAAGCAIALSSRDLARAEAAAEKRVEQVAQAAEGVASDTAGGAVVAEAVVAGAALGVGEGLVGGGGLLEAALGLGVAGVGVFGGLGALLGSHWVVENELAGFAEVQKILDRLGAESAGAVSLPSP